MKWNFIIVEIWVSGFNNPVKYIYIYIYIYHSGLMCVGVFIGLAILKWSSRW